MTQAERPDLSGGLSEELLGQERVIEELIRVGRFPLIFSGSRGKEQVRRDRPTEMIPCKFVFVPPSGTLYGDRVDGSTDVGFEFISPDGKSRGQAQLFTVDLEKGETLSSRVRAIAETLDLPKPHLYTR